MVAYWLIPLREENWYVVLRNNIFGARANSPALKKIKIGDLLIFYVSKSGSIKLGGKIVGVFQVITDWFFEEVPLWPEETSKKKTIYSWRIRLKPIKIGTTNFKDLVQKLKFIKRKDKAQVYLMGVPANFRSPIPEEDAKTIIESLR